MSETFFYSEYEQNQYQFKSSTQKDTYISEIINQYDCRTQSLTFAMEKETEVFITVNTWKLLCFNDVPIHFNILWKRISLPIKYSGTNRKTFKARFVVQLHNDIAEKFLAHHASIAQQQSARTPIGIAAIFGSRMFSIYIT